MVLRTTCTPHAACPAACPGIPAPTSTKENTCLLRTSSSRQLGELQLATTKWWYWLGVTYKQGVANSIATFCPFLPYFVSPPPDLGNWDQPKFSVGSTSSRAKKSLPPLAPKLQDRSSWAKSWLSRFPAGSHLAAEKLRFPVGPAWGGVGPPRFPLGLTVSGTKNQSGGCSGTSRIGLPG